MTYQKRRDYCFTVNNWGVEDTLEVDALFATEKVRYIIVGKETGAEGVSHLQGYVYFHNAVPFSTVKKALTRAHIEPCKGNPDQNITYCSKDGDFLELGERPISQKRKGEMSKERWDTILDSAKKGKIEEIPSDIQIRYYRTLRLIQKDYMASVPDTSGCCGVWYYGDSGAGKSRQARIDYPDPYLKMCNKWWDGYQNQPYVLIEDFDKLHAHLGHHLKLWGDRYSFLAESKGSAHTIRPDKIIITSNYHPSEIWPDQPKTLEPILRRFIIKQFHLTL